MDQQKFVQELNMFDANASIERAFTPPSSWYLEKEFWENEKRSVFANSWLFVGRMDQVATPESYFCGCFLDESYIVVKNKDGELKAFYNVCRHHAAAVASGAGKIKKFVCPYHGWSYKLDGSLDKAPRINGIKNFAKENHGLVPIPLAVWGSFIFLFFGSTPTCLESELSPLKEQLDKWNTSTLRFIERKTYRIKCNWKVFVDNYLDGGYHVAYLHKGLASQLDLKNYKQEIFPKFSLQICSAKKDSKPKKQDFSARVEGGALYAWLYPNFMINRYGPIMDINWVIPIGYEETEVVFDYFFDEKCSDDFVEKSIIASDIVQQEDTQICESVQLGLKSRAYYQGRYVPLFEAPAIHFHQLLAKDLKIIAI